jgi:hypothetical protein
VKQPNSAELHPRRRSRPSLPPQPEKRPPNLPGHRFKNHGVTWPPILAQVFDLIAVKASACPLSVHWLEWLAVGVGRKVIGRSQQTTCFYLVETTRTYAAEKLIEPAPVPRRHPQYFAAFFEKAEADLETGPMPVFLEAYSRRIDDVRSALGWAFSADGDGAVGVPLTVASAPIWARLSSHKSALVQVGRRSDR